MIEDVQFIGLRYGISPRTKRRSSYFSRLLAYSPKVIQQKTRRGRKPKEVIIAKLKGQVGEQVKSFGVVPSKSQILRDYAQEFIEQGYILALGIEGNRVLPETAIADLAAHPNTPRELRAIAMVQLIDR